MILIQSPKVTPAVRAARNRLWRKGKIASWKLRPYQRKLKDMIDRAGRELVVPNIARKIGKTTVCLLYCIEQAIKSRKHIRYATAFLSDLTEFLLPIFELIIADCPEDVRPTYKESKKEFRFPTSGSVIKLVGLDKNRNGLRGNIIDILVIDESAFVKNLKYLYESVIIPATKNRPFKLIFPSTPPESPEHFWAKSLVPKAKARDTYIEMTLDADTELSAEERKRLLDEVGGEKSATAQREYFCKIIVDIARALAPSFDHDRHVLHDGHVLRPTVSDFLELFIRWMIFSDMGGIKDKHAYQQIGWSHELQKTLFNDEITFDPMTPTPVMVAAVQAKWPKIPIYMDKPGQTAVDLSALGMPTGNVKKIVDGFAAGIAYLNTHLHNDQVLIHPRCKMLIDTLAGGLLTESRLDHERTEYLGHNDHGACMIYGLRGVDKITDLRPRPNFLDMHLTNAKPAHEQALAALAWRRS